MTRRTLIIILLICLAFILGAWLFKWYLFKTTPLNEVPQTNSYQTIVNEFVNLAQNKIPPLKNIDLSEGSDLLNELNNYQLVVADYVLFTEGTSTNWLAAEKKTGYLYLGNTVSKAKTKISNLPFLNIDHLGVLTKKDGLVVIIRNKDLTNKTSVKAIDLDLTTGSSSVSELPSNIKDFVISPDQQQAVFLQEIGERESWLLTDNTLTEFKTIYSTSYQNFNLNWANPDVITFYPKPSEQTIGTAYSFNLKNNLVEKLGVGLGLELNISPNLKQTIISTNNNNKVISNIKTPDGTFIIPTTASKCLPSDQFSSLCAVPHYYLTSIDNWYKGKTISSDDFYLIDHQTGKPTKWRVLPNLDVVNIQSTPDQNLVFFIDKTSGNLWSALTE